MDRRKFLKLLGGGTGALVTTATLAEAGWLAEVLDWLRRKPVTFVPKYYSQTISLNGFVEALNDGCVSWYGTIYPIYGTQFRIVPGSSTGIVEYTQRKMDEAVASFDIQIRRDMIRHGIRS